MKTERQSLADLARENEKSACNLSCMIAARSKKIDAARRKGDREMMRRHLAERSDLCAQREHVLQIAAFLKHYYRQKGADETDEL